MYAQLDIDLGPKNVRETAEMMGITTPLDGIPAEGLGGLRLGVSPLEMANAYATLASYGIHNEPMAITKVEFPDGKTDELGKPKRKRVFPEWVAYEATKILEQNVLGGTGTAAQIGCDAAGKTGTTDNFNDAWFVGYTPHLAASVWVGYPNALVEMTQRARDQRRRRHVPGADLAVVHDRREGDRLRLVPRRPWTSPEFTPVLRPVRLDRHELGHELQLRPTATRHPRRRAGDNSAGGEDDSGYDPRLYESPPQEAPEAPAPAPRAGRRRRRPAGNGRQRGRGTATGTG